MLINTGMAQANAAVSTIDWGMQDALAIITDKAMYLLVIARSALCEKGRCGGYQLIHRSCDIMCLPANEFLSPGFGIC